MEMVLLWNLLILLLSVEQALADFSLVVQRVQSDWVSSARIAPVITFGGSYGGMLAAWMRLHYPALVCGTMHPPFNSISNHFCNSA